MRLVEDLWDGIRERPESLPVSERQRVELDRRLQEHRRKPEAAESLDVVLKRLATHLKPRVWIVGRKFDVQDDLVGPAESRSRWCLDYP